MRVIIRTDGNREIAMGHMMRCLSIADALRAYGAEAVFVMAGGEMRHIVTERGYESHCLGTSFRETERELPALHSFFCRNPADYIIVDSYFVTERYLQELGRWTKTVYIDDLGEPVYPADVLINYNIYADAQAYGERYREARIRLPEKMLLGCAYAPLRDEFRDGEPRRERETAADVLITTGGGDYANAAGKLCERLAREKRRGLHRGVRYHVVCGPLSENRQILRKFAEEQPDFVIHENVTYMSELMRGCDAAVSAAGSTMYELCSMGLPAVCFYFADNQRRMAECFDRTSEIKNAGNIADDEDGVIDRLSARLLELEQDSALRARLRAQMRALTDGKGADRIARALMCME